MEDVQFQDQAWCLGLKPQKKMKGHCDLGHEDSIASASSFLGSPHETWCPLNGEEKIRSSQTPPPNSRGDSSLCTGAQHALRDSPLTCSHTLGTEQTTANDMVQAQWERPLNSRQACHSKAVRSTYNFLPLLQGQKVKVRQSRFTKYCAFLWGTKGLL